MTRTTRKMVKKVIFWIVIILAPVVFLSMLLFYLNSYLTSERLIFFFNPIIEAVTEKKTSIGNADINLGWKSTFTLTDISLSSKPIDNETTDSVETTHIENFTVQFRLLSLFFGPMEIDSIIITGMSGIFPFERFQPFSDITWTDTSGSRTVQVNIGLSDLDDVKIKSFVIRNTSFTYRNFDHSSYYYIDNYWQALRIDVSALMNLVLINGQIEGTLIDLSEDSPACSVIISGRMQINIDDKSIFFREGLLQLNEIELPFSALVNTTDEQTRWRIFFDKNREDVEQGLTYLPPSVLRLLYSEEEEGKIYFDMLYPEENDSH